MNAHNTCHPDTFQSLYFKYHSALRRFIYYKNGIWEITEDLVQEAFLRLWKHCSEVPPDKAGSYLYTICNRLFLDEARKQQVAFKFRQHQNHQPESITQSPEYDLEMQEFKLKLEAAIQQLPETQRMVFLLNRIDKLTYAEIAAQLEISVKAVEKRMHLALIQLRTLCANI